MASFEWAHENVILPKGRDLFWLKEGGEEGEGKNEPAEWSVCKNDGSLSILPRRLTDFWCRTYYEPTLLKGNGHGLVVGVEDGKESVVTTSFELKPKFQFDQGGVLLFGDKENWIKAGMEAVDGVPKSSVVVTVNGFSDWSSFPSASTVKMVCFAFPFLPF